MPVLAGQTSFHWLAVAAFAATMNVGAGSATPADNAEESLRALSMTQVSPANAVKRRK